MEMNLTHRVRCPPWPEEWWCMLGSTVPATAHLGGRVEGSQRREKSRESPNWVFNAVSELQFAHVKMGIILPTSCYPPPVTEWPLVLPRGALPLPLTSVLIAMHVTLSLSPAACPLPAHIPTGQPVTSSLFQPRRAELRPL